MTVRTDSSPVAFKQALEQRLKAASKSGVDFARRRQLLVSMWDSATRSSASPISRRQMICSTSPASLRRS